MQETRMMLRNIGKINPISSMEYAKLGGYASLRLALSFPNTLFPCTIYNCVHLVSVHTT